MKIPTKFLITIPFLLAAVALFYGCKEDAFDNDGNDSATGYTYHITAETGAAQEHAQANGKARSLTLDTNSLVHSTWEAGDQLMVYNLSDNDQSTDTAYSLLNVVDTNTQFSAFEGTLVSKNQVSTNDRLCFLYPGGAALPNSNLTITPVIKQTRTMSGAIYDYYEPDNSKIKHLVYLDLSQQDGSIATISKKFDYQWAAVHPQSVNGNDVKCTVGPLQREIAIWAIKDPGRPRYLQIDNIKSADVFDLGTGEFATGNHSNKKYRISILPYRFYYNPPQDGYLYVAVPPGTYYDVVITRLYVKGARMTTYKRITFEKDKVYRTTLPLKSDVATSKPYVEVQGVKWAQGNFIYDKDRTPDGNPDDSVEYWGIAPKQWWISGTKTSQLQQAYHQTASQVDLFRFGAIASALNLTSGDYMRGGTNISKKLYTDNLGQNTTTDSAQAQYGDIVWLHTRNRTQKYRLPSDAEMRALYEHANVKAAFVKKRFSYTPAAMQRDTNGIYGFYFWTNHGEPRIQILPTRINQRDQYEDVTSLLRLNKGLFLPFTGKRAANSDLVEFKYVYYFGGVYGQYMTDLLSSNALNWDFCFGNTTWNYTPNNSKGEAVAIRPVWDETSDEDGIDDSYYNYRGDIWRGW